jgi:hypothetical protein
MIIIRRCIIMRRLRKVQKCRECEATNMLVKVKNFYLCFEHYKESKAGPSELQALIEESVRNGLEYFDPLYAKEIRKRERKIGRK